MSRPANEIVAQALRRVREGKVPCTEPHKEYGGPGENTSCDICGRLIVDKEIEIEAVYPEVGSLFFHVACMAALRAACAELQSSP